MYGDIIFYENCPACKTLNKFSSSFDSDDITTGNDIDGGECGKCKHKWIFQETLDAYEGIPDCPTVETGFIERGKVKRQKKS